MAQSTRGTVTSLLWAATAPTARVLGASSAALLVMGLAGCGGSAQQTAPTAQVTAPQSMSSQSTASARPGSEAIDREAYEKLGYRLAWSGFASFDTTSGGRTKFVEPMGDALAIQDSAASITLLSASSGEQLWATAIADPLTKFLGLARRNGRVLAVTETEVFALDVDSGAIISRSRLDRVAASGPVQVGNAILLGTISRVAFAQLTDRNASAWAFTLTGPSTIDPALFETFAIAYPTDDGNVTVLDPASGALRGSTRMFGPAGGAVAAGDLAFFVPSLDQSLYAVDARNGQTRWRLRTESPLNRPAVFAGGAVYTVVGPRGLACIEPGTGKVRWAQEKVTGDAVATAKGRVIAFDARSGKAWSVDPADGSVVAEITLANVAVLKATRVDEGELYAVSATGEVSKFSPH